MRQATSNAIMWVACCLVTALSIYITKQARPLFALIIPTIVTMSTVTPSKK